ncbi:MAG: MFS transporter [Anaerolineales bacterium]|nr:MFS transporter [Anaerolineales bacterium]
MLATLKSGFNKYPSQFWLLFGGMFISVLGMSMIWPFLMIYVKGKLGLPMTQVASLMTVSAAAALVFSFISGPIIDRVGRKWTMVFSLAANGLGFLLLNFANSLLGFSALMALRGAVNPMYQIGADAMLADLIEPENRADAYALTRLSKNAGIAIGPAIGGFLAGISYSITFYIAFGGLVLFALLLALMASETRPEQIDQTPSAGGPLAGYDHIFKDRPFMGLVSGFTLVQVCATLVWVLMGVYVTENFGLTEAQYGLIPMTNALMVVAFQVFVTNRSKHRPPLWIMSLGALFYTAGVTSVGLGSDFWVFWLSMVILTLGELLLVPTATTFAANLAPPDMRGRYMSLYSLSWQAAAGIGPLIGGILNDQISPKAIWFGGGLFGLAGVVYFVISAVRAGSSKKLDLVGN